MFGRAAGGAAASALNCRKPRLENSLMATNDTRMGAVQSIFELLIPLLDRRDLHSRTVKARHLLLGAAAALGFRNPIRALQSGGANAARRVGRIRGEYARRERGRDPARRPGRIRPGAG